MKKINKLKVCKPSKKKIKQLGVATLSATVVGTAVTSALASANETTTSVANTEVTSVEYVASNENTVNIQETNTGEASTVTNSGLTIEAYLGGGPSPTVGWKKGSSYQKTFTHSQLGQISSKYQGIVSSDKYEAGQKALNASVTIAGILGRPTVKVTAAVAGAYGHAYFTAIQDSANVVASAYAKGGNRTLTVQEYDYYKTPGASSTGKMYVFK